MVLARIANEHRPWLPRIAMNRWPSQALWIRQWLLCSDDQLLDRHGV